MIAQEKYFQIKRKEITGKFPGLDSFFLFLSFPFLISSPSPPSFPRSADAEPPGKSAAEPLGRVGAGPAWGLRRGIVPAPHPRRPSLGPRVGPQVSPAAPTAPGESAPQLWGTPAPPKFLLPGGLSA